MSNQKEGKKEVVESTTVKTIRKLKDNKFTANTQQNAATEEKEELKVEERLLNASQLEDDYNDNSDDEDEAGVDIIVPQNDQKQEEDKQGDNNKKEKSNGKKELLSPQTKLKRQIKPKNTFGVKEDPTNYQSSVGEYHNINMEIAISYVLSKSKVLKEKIEIEKLGLQFLKENIVDNKHFNLAFNSYMQKLINKRQLNPDFKNVSKKTMARLEKFFVERIDKQIESLKIHQEYQEKAKFIQDQFDQRIALLKEKIKEKSKIN